MKGTLSAVVTLALPQVVNVSATDDALTLCLEDGRMISVPIERYPHLVRGTQISVAGYGTHWPELDEDIDVEGLVLGKRSTESPASFERWLQ